MSASAGALDVVTRTAPLGVRFWDLATHRPVTDGLVVTARPQGRPGAGVTLKPNASGVHVLHGGPVPGEVVRGDGSDAFWAAVAPKPFALEARDLKGRFLPLTLSAPVPHKGFLTAAVASPPGDAHDLLAACAPPAYVPLFSTPARGAVAGQGLIRANLKRRADEAPASGALVVVEAAGEAVGFGLADPRGDLAIVFPFPELPRRMGAPSPLTAPTGVLPVFSLTVALRVFHDVGASPLPATPDFAAIASQPEAALLGRKTPRAVLGPILLELGDALRVESLGGDGSLYVD